ncbi:MAG: glycosyl hydrolase [Ignavibacteria bacterium]|nr:glycosyl hydrolase [Ignavibacteria bacterium]
MKLKYLSILLFILLLSLNLFAQEESKENKDPMNSSTFKGLKWRGIGPALTSGRISDFAFNPNNFSEYYVGVASGHVWKTTNAGTTYEPIFDNQGAYSIGCLAIDPNNPFVVWIGTGENNHQRALGYGNGVYKSIDGGKSWKNMGLKESRQIGKIVIDPRNSNNIFVAAEGSVWGSGGERGLYKSIDGGKTWKKVLDISEHTGVNNLIYDPRNPDVMYATSEQRRRHVFTKIGGGPESAVYKSEDAGETWEKIMNGLPKVDIGGMGIDISPANPDIIYIIMEAAEKAGGFFRSTNRGASWEKMSSYTSSGQYFNEIVCDPKNTDKVYSLEVVSKVTTDAGKTWVNVGINDRHVDDHALWINPNNTDHLLMGGDGGIYESFDMGKNWNFKTNLPVTQFYRVFADNSTPFYFIYGGTQDNSSMGGPSRTISADGIVNSDWFITNGGDGFWSSVDPENQNIVYAESQYGGMVRYDKQSGEAVDIRPEPRKGENTYKWNWDTPLFISPHKNTRIYCAANKVFRSEDRGDTWEVISDDLSAQIDRNSWPVMGKYWSVDAVSKDKSTSLFGMVVSMTESPLKENLLYAGTDDGLIQVSEDAKTWRKVSNFPGLPENTYVSDILASKFDENIVYATFNNHKRDDFKPYVYRSNDKGKTWKSISADLHVNGSVWSIEQDYVNADLLFVGTEFSFFFSVDGGNKWIQLNSGLPDIPVRDISIQKRESDLVIGTFGRGFYVIDDYSALRNISKDMLNKEAYLFPIKDALMYIPSTALYAQGANYYRAPNPEFGAALTYYVKDVPKTLKEIRNEKEKLLFKDGKAIPQPTEEELLAEQREVAPYLVFNIKDEGGNVIRKITKNASKGVQRLNWDLRFPNLNSVSTEKFDPSSKQQSTTPVMPGKYSANMEMVSRDGVKILSDEVSFNAETLRNTTLPTPDRNELVTFQKKSNELGRIIRGTHQYLNDVIKQVTNLRQAVISTPSASHELLMKADKLAFELDNISLMFSRRSDSPSAEENSPSPVTFTERLGTLAYTHWRSTSKLTKNETRAYEILAEEFPPVYNQIKKLAEVDLKELQNEIDKLGGPVLPSTLPELKIK